MLKTLLILVALNFTVSCLKEDVAEHVSKIESAKKFARIKTIHGDIIFKFENKKAPVTSARIKKLIQEKFYNGLTFHRTKEDFIIQTGDPTGKGNGGSGQNIKAEFNNLKHRPGTVAMARQENDINSADSQFYISLTFSPELDGKYTIFGQVTEGLEVIKKINQGDKIIFMSLE